MNMTNFHFNIFSILLFATIFGWSNNLAVNYRILQRRAVEEGRNTGCDLFNKANVAFKYMTIVFFSQRLVFNSLEDTERLLKHLVSFLSNCCSERPKPECFFSKDIILQGRICEDEISQSKNRLAVLCCYSDNLEKERCFVDLQNNSTLQLPLLGDHVSYEEECLAWKLDKHVFIKSYLHGFAKRLKKFPPSLTINLFHSFLLMYVKCCEGSENIHKCFSVEKIAFPVSIRNKIEEENQMCLLAKQWKNGHGALIFYAKMNPSDSKKKALDFEEMFMKLASQCCEPDNLISECFEAWPEVIFTRICLLMENNLQKACCLRSNHEKEECLTKLAVQESKKISNITIELHEICILSRNSELFNWIAYEYPRRHPNETLTSLLDSVTGLTILTTNCCATNDTKSCGLPNFYTFFEV